MNVQLSLDMIHHYWPACLASFLRAAAKLDDPGVADRAEAAVPPTDVMPLLEGDTWLSGGTVAVVRFIELTMVNGGGFVPAAGMPARINQGHR